MFEGESASLKVQPRIPKAGLLGIRPEKIKILPGERTPTDSALENEMAGVVELVSYLGPSTEFRVRIASDRYVLVQQGNREATQEIEAGKPGRLSVPSENCFLFEAEESRDQPSRHQT